jgi:hypothetical protein
MYFDLVSKDALFKLREAQELTQQQLTATQGVLACKMDKVCGIVGGMQAC